MCKNMGHFLRLLHSIFNEEANSAKYNNNSYTLFLWQINQISAFNPGKSSQYIVQNKNRHVRWTSILKDNILYTFIFFLTNAKVLEVN